MSCCDPCDCIATVRVRQLVNADHAFDVLLPPQSSVREQREWWYGDTLRSLRQYHCRWSSIAEIDADTRYEVRVWNSRTAQPLLTIAPLDEHDRPLCLHVFSSLSDPHDDYTQPAAHAWSVNVIDEGSEIYRIEFRGQHLGYPVPLELLDAGHDPADITRDEKLELISFASPGNPQVYWLTKALDLDSDPLLLRLQTWSGSPVPLTISADATADDIRYAIAPDQAVTHTLPAGGGTTESLELYASPDGVDLSLEIAGPELPTESLPDGETITFAVWHATQPDFSDEVELYDDVLELLGFGGTGTPALSATRSLPGAVKRYVRVKAVASSGVDAGAFVATISLAGAQSLPPISAECSRGVVDLYGYAETLGDASLGPQIDWSALTIWLTFHKVETPPTHLRNDVLFTSWVSQKLADEALFDTRGRLYFWPIDPAGARFEHFYRQNESGFPSLEPPWFVLDLTGGRAEPGIEYVWLDEPSGMKLRFDPYVVVTATAIVLRLFIAAEGGRDEHGYGWFEYRSAEPPDLINGMDCVLKFAGYHCQSPRQDSDIPRQPDVPPNIVRVPMAQAINLAGESLHFQNVTFRALLTDLGRENGVADPTVTTGYTLTANGWDGGATANGDVPDLNGSHLLEGEQTQTFPNFPNVSFEWLTIAFRQIVEGLSYELINYTPFVPDQPAALQEVYRHTDRSRWLPARQCLVVHIDGQHYYYRPKTRAVVSDDPDELVFEIDPDPPTLTWPGSGVVSVTSQPTEITLRVGPALLSNHCPECVENQQPTPMAFELTVPGITATDEPISLLRRADSMWAAHVPGVKPHWLEDGDPVLPDPLHDQLWILDGLETLRLWEVPVNGGPRRPIAVYRFRPVEHPIPQPREDDPGTADIDETWLGWQTTGLDCVSERKLTLWMFGQGYDPARHLLPSAVRLKPIGRQCVYSSADYDWQHSLNRWEADAGNSEERPPDDFGLPKLDMLRPDSEHRTICAGYDGTDAGIIWIDDVERWRVFATSCGQTELPSVPRDPDNGEPGDIRRIRCHTPDPPPPPVSPCRFISNDGVAWEQIPPDPGEVVCPEGHECRPPFNLPQFVGDVTNGYCEPVSCLGGESEWVWLNLPGGGQWFWQSDTCPDWCEPLAPGHVGAHLEVAKGTCWCPTCT
jgi:hypothetical protein